MILRLNRYPDLFGLIPWLMLVCLLRNVEGGFFLLSQTRLSALAFHLSHYRKSLRNSACDLQQMNWLAAAFE